ncbi:MAG: EAL domain-containing protein [Steroidobacterales bacterium]
MSAPIETFRSYGALLQRLLPQFSHALITATDGAVHWASDPEAPAALHSMHEILTRCATDRPADIDGLADPEGRLRRFGFRVRDALGGPLALVLIAAESHAGQPLDLATVHAHIKPALDCLQSELSLHAAHGELEAALLDGTDSLGQVPTLALEVLAGVLGALLLPDCNLSICRSAKGQPRAHEAELLAQLHEILLTRAQVHRRTLVANHLQLDSSGAPQPYKVISTPIYGPLQRVIGVLAVLRPDAAADFQMCDTEALERLARKAGLIAGASFDFFTGFLTESAFIGQACARLAAQRACAGSSGLLYFDVDQLHVVNETHGMPVGDEVIGKIAQLLRSRARGGTLVARIAGDRFAMFVPGCSIEPAARIAEEIRASAVKLSGPLADKPVQVSLSVGVARIAERDRNFRQALAAAELACQTAKDRGRNRVEVFYGSLPSDQTIRGVRRAAAQMAAASVRDSLELLAQPVLPLGMIHSTPRFEIFMRMRAADGTRLNFEKLICADASAELPRMIDWWVVEQTIARLASQRDRLRQYPAQFSVNLSAESLGHSGFWPMLEQALRSAALPPGTVAFEFSEDAALSQIATLPGNMHQLRALGASFAIDNFGRGIGSLSNLASLPLSCIKIDGSLSCGLDHDPRSDSMVLAIARLAQGFGLETVVSQVETDAIRARAAQIGVDFGQGFFIGKMLDLDDAIHDLPLYSCFETPIALVG